LSASKENQTECKLTSVKVSPGSKKTEVIVLGDGSLKVQLKSQPKKGKANKELISVISIFLDLPESSLKIIRGATKRHKIIEIVTK